MRFRVLLFCLIGWSVSAHSQLIEEITLMHDGLERTYVIYVPEIYNESTAVPLVINMHGLGSNSQEQMIYGNFTAIADTANFIIVHPQGTEDGQGTTFWNSFSDIGVDDVGFISAVIDDVLEQYNVDENCIYSTGMSNGGFMSYYLACRLSDRITAIASVTGSMVIGLPESCNAQHPTPVMEIHGTSDGVVPYNGSVISESIDDVVEYWVSFNNCNPSGEFSEVPDVVSSDDCTAEHYVYSNGDLGSSVELYKVIGGDHSWPGAIINLNVTNMDFNASKEIWRFFRQYKLDMLTSVAQTNSNESEVIVYPNPGVGICNAVFTDASGRTLRIYDAYGKLISSDYVSSSTFTFSLPTPGIYCLQVEGADGFLSRKLIYE